MIGFCDPPDPRMGCLDAAQCSENSVYKAQIRNINLGSSGIRLFFRDATFFKGDSMGLVDDVQSMDQFYTRMMKEIENNERKFEE